MKALAVIARVVSLCLIDDDKRGEEKHENRKTHL